MRSAINSGVAAIDFSPNVSGGTINLTSQLTITKSVTINNTTGNPITLLGDWNFQLIQTAAGTTDEIDNLELEQGAGGIYNSGALTLNGCYLSLNSAAFGGAIYNSLGASLSLNNTNFFDNTAQQDGGGIYNYGGSVTYNSGSMTKCSAQNDGGGIWTDSDGSNSYTAVGNNVTIQTCSASQDGGGIYVARGSQATGVGLTMGWSALLGNFAGHDGGGLYIDTGAAQLTGTAIQNNTATNEGGGFLLNSRGALTLSVITGGGNRAATGPGGACVARCSYENDGSFTDVVVIVAKP